MYFNLDTGTDPDGTEAAIQRFMDFVPVPLVLTMASPAKPKDQLERQVIHVNKAFTEQIGYLKSQIPDLRHYFVRAYPDDKYRQLCMNNWRVAVESCLDASSSLAETIALIECSNGDQRWFAIAIETVSQFDPRWHMISFRDVHDIKRQLDMFDNLARLDPLTDLLNRREITRLLEVELGNFNITEHPFSVLICDLDHFKQVNDLYGHDAGDVVLKAVAACFQKSLRASDHVARWGGEEFLIMLPNTPLKRAIMIGNRLLKNIGQLACKWQTHEISPTTSIGLASIEKGQTVDQLVTLADQALYRAKNRGRNQLAIAGELVEPSSDSQ